jgi:hypothetical protein
MWVWNAWYNSEKSDTPTEVFEDDLKSSSPYDFQRWQQRSLAGKNR